MVIKKFQNPQRHQNPISGSKVTVILLKGWILPIGGASVGEGLRLQPTTQACLMSSQKGQTGADILKAVYSSWKACLPIN